MHKRKKHFIKTAQELYKTGQLMFWDKFTDSDGTNLSAHSNIYYNPLKLSWVKDNTFDLDIYSNSCSSQDVSNDVPGKENDHYIETYKTGLTVECKCLVTAFDTYAALPSVMIRYVDTDNHFTAQLQAYSGTPNLFGIVFRKQVSGTNTELASLMLDTSLINTQIDLKLVDTGTTVAAYYGDELIGTVTDSDFSTATKIGIKAQSVRCRWDDFKVYKA